jgi:hypothetical protein
MKIAYADPPYLGCAKLYQCPDAAKYDKIDGHRRLIRRLCKDYPDGWLYSLHVPSLRQILPLCPEDCRVGSWVKPFAAFKVGVPIAYTWEPVIFRGGRTRTRSDRTVKDHVICSIAMEKGTVGAKPEQFCWWMFDLMGMDPDDEFHDLFPGSGSVQEAWESYRRWNGGIFTPEFCKIETDGLFKGM